MLYVYMWWNMVILRKSCEFVDAKLSLATWCYSEYEYLGSIPSYWRCCLKVAMVFSFPKEPWNWEFERYMRALTILQIAQNYGWQGLQQLCYRLQIRVYEAPSNSCVSSTRKRPRPIMNKFYHRLLQSSKYRRSSGTTSKSKLRQITTSHVIVFTKNCTKIIRLNSFMGHSHNNNIFMWRLRAFENACYEMEFGKQR